MLILALGVAGHAAGTMQMAGQQGTTADPPSEAVLPGKVALPPTVKRGVEAIVSMRDQLHPASSKSKETHKKSYDITVDAASDWTDTGATVATGEQITVDAKGTASLADGRVSGPEGLDRGWKDLLRQFPARQAKTGELIGRVSDVEASVPFPLGANGTATMPTSGHLYLRSNVSDDLTATGSYKVHIRFSEAAASQPAVQTGPPSNASAISTLVGSATFSEIPRRVSDEAENPGDMVNFALVGTESQVKAAFASAGWVAVDKSVGDAVLHGILSTLSHEAYTEMPMSTLYLFGRPQDLSFARADPLKVAAERHHLRVWKTDQMVEGEPLWVGSATHDIGFERDERNGKTTHKIDPEIDKERQFLLQSFDATGAFASAAYVTPADPLRTARTATGGSFFSDGRILVMQLK